MNFQDLLTKIKKIDEMGMEPPTMPLTDPADGDAEFDESSDQMLAGECGGMMSPQMSAPKQSDSVTMNVSMNGSGAGGIKDLLDIIRNIESASEPESDAVLVGIGAEESMDGDFGSATTEPEPRMIPTPDSGDDLHREKDEYPKANGGGNPMRMHETLVSKLSARYNEIKGE